jgi:hypothetical protein
VTGEVERQAQTVSYVRTSESVCNSGASSPTMSWANSGHRYRPGSGGICEEMATQIVVFTVHGGGMNQDTTTQHITGEAPLTGRIALVAGATRGAGRALAVELGRLGATVYVTGRTTRTRASEIGRTTETIEETGELVTAAGGTGIAVPTDHLDEDQVRALVGRIEREQERLDVLVNDL